MNYALNVAPVRQVCGRALIQDLLLFPLIVQTSGVFFGIIAQDVHNQLELLFEFYHGQRKKKYQQHAAYQQAKRQSALTNSTLPAVFREDEVRLMTLCRDLVRHLMPAKMDSAMNQTLLQASGLLAEKTDEVSVLDTVAAVAVKGKIDCTPFHEMLCVLMDAVRSRRVCDITYKKVIGQHALRL